ncbi:hypothetical protein CALCODRAFT_294657 [Calocera cornea HHB12733]|uniref:Uncharacterized protein n=1 Tax=Calocera cornea HHB12733 TaxID=1353952 RepID=A0A165FS31_9BASI|nr:hypothetical protein CALCODRAFT_294657 [Calocera cornea HHB12733]
MQCHTSSKRQATSESAGEHPAWVASALFSPIYPDFGECFVYLEIVCIVEFHQNPDFTHHSGAQPMMQFHLQMVYAANLACSTNRWSYLAQITVCYNHWWWVGKPRRLQCMQSLPISVYPPRVCLRSRCLPMAWYASDLSQPFCYNRRCREAKRSWHRLGKPVPHPSSPPESEHQEG